MIRQLTFVALSLAALAGCQTQSLGAPSGEVGRAAPPAQTLTATSTDACWATDTVPAVVQTVYVDNPETGAREPHQVTISQAENRMFAVPCPDQMTSELTASLQRALSARGHYSGAITGTYDAATAEAVRSYQAPLGLNSARLSLDAAQQLGLVALPRESF